MTSNLGQLSVNDSHSLYLGDAKPIVALNTGLENEELNKIINWPRKVAFKAANGKYISVERFFFPTTPPLCYEYIQATKNVMDKDCEFEVITFPENYIALKCSNGYYLNEGVNKKDERCFLTEINEHCKFRYISVGDNKVALKCFSNLFLTNVDTQGSILFTKDQIEQSSIFIIDENIIKKEMVNVRYDLDNALVTTIKPLTTIIATVINPLDEPITKVLTFTYMRSLEGTWSNEVGVSVEITCGIPNVADSKFTVTVSSSYSHQWGGSETESTEVSDATEVVVSPKTILSVQIFVWRAQINVNFIYDVYRMLADGTTQIEGGLRGFYTNVDCYESEAVPVNIRPYEGNDSFINPVQKAL
jgi:hypothetical protein